LIPSVLCCALGLIGVAMAVGAVVPAVGDAMSVDGAAAYAAIIPVVVTLVFLARVAEPPAGQAHPVAAEQPGRTRPGAVPQRAAHRR
jgi:hypothetical protein